MEYKAAYYILMYLAYQLFFSVSSSTSARPCLLFASLRLASLSSAFSFSQMFQVPYTSLTMHISPEPKVCCCSTSRLSGRRGPVVAHLCPLALVC